MQFLWCRQKTVLIFKENLKDKQQNYENHKGNAHPLYTLVIFLMQSLVFSIG